MLRESLNNGAGDHDTTTAENRPATPKPVVDNANQRQRKDGTERVGRGNNPLKRVLRVSKV